MQFYLFLTSVYLVSSSTYCPYPLPSSIKPCYCKIYSDKNVYVTCYIGNSEDEFSTKEFTRIASAFDYNNKIHTLKITNGGGVCRNDCNEKFSSQMNKDTLGKLNITILELEDVMITSDLFGYGAFDGSRGSIEEISVRFKNSEENTFIHLPNQILEPACPTLKTIELFGVSYLPSTTFQGCTSLETLHLYNSNLHTIPSGVFSNMANLKRIEISIFPKFMIASSAFSNLSNLTSLTFQPTGVIENQKYKETGHLPEISLIQAGAFDNLPKLKTLRIVFNVDEFEKEAFKDLVGIEYFAAYKVMQTHLPRLFTNSPILKSFLFKEKLLSFDENAFDGVPNLKGLYLSGNPGLTVLNQDQYKPVIEQIGSKNGTIVMSNLVCGCDVKWLFSKPAWVDVMKKATCLGYNKKMEDVDAALLDDLCPSNF